ncbi:MAG: hypothetical protein U0791_20535 [Gemmataceae bacterium]
MMRSVFTANGATSSALRALNYSPITERFKRVKEGRKVIPLRDLLQDLGEAWGTVFTRVDCDPKYGVNLLSQVDVFSSEPEGRSIRRDSMPRPDRHLIRKWQVLLSGAGQMGESTLFGRAIIADDRLAGKYVGPDSVVMSLAEPEADLSLYAYAFLLTEAGTLAVKSCAYGTSIPRVRLDLLGSMLIPIATDHDIARVASFVRATVAAREDYYRHVKLARAALEHLPEMQHAISLCGERKARCVVWNRELPTLCAWNVASTGGALAFLKRNWKARLGDILQDDGVFNGPRFARISCKQPYGIDFYSQRDLFLIRRVPRRIVHPGFNDDLLFVPEGSLLIGGHGTLGEGEIFGRVVYVSGRLSRAGFTQDLLRVIPRVGMSALAYTFLSSQVGFRLLRSTGVGTKLLMMRTDLLSVPATE